MKMCSHCKQMLPDSDFCWKVKGVKLAYNCRKCSRDYIRKHYENNKQYYLDKAKKGRDKNRQVCFTYLRSYLKEHPCVDCGEKDIAVLEFDHKDRRDKDDNIAGLLKNNATNDRLSREVLKCDVRCANCHRRKTNKETNSWRLK